MKCNTCGEDKSVEELHARKDRPSGYQGHCKACNKSKIYEARDKFKKQCIDYKGGCCSICGYDKYLGALEFHHIDPSQKDFVINKSTYRKFDSVKNELDKYILLCANCHREVHAGISG